MALVEKADDFLKVAIGIAVLAAGLGAGYYYSVFLPGVEAEAREAEAQLKFEAQRSNVIDPAC